MKYLFIFLCLLVLNGCASKKPSNIPEKDAIIGDVNSTIDQHSKEVEACYENYLKVKSTAQGRMLIHWAISQNGEVKEIKLKENPFEDETVFNCIAEQLKSWKFSTNLQKDKDVLISFPFMFQVHTEKL